MPKLYVVLIRWAANEKNRDALEGVFSSMGDWLYFTNSCWLVWSDKGSAGIYQLLAPHLSSADNEMIFEIVPGTRYGWAPQWAWEWVDARLKKQTDIAA